MQRIRPPAVAGSFYPADTHELTALLDQCLNSSPLGPQGAIAPSASLLGGMIPHAGYIYSGPCAAHLYARVGASSQRVILLGVNHSARGNHASLSPWDIWQTPLGNVKVDQELSNLLESQVRFLSKDEPPHQQEHSIEVQLPFLQYLLRDFTFLPISLSYLSLKDCAELGNAIAEVCAVKTPAQKHTLILASSDLSHYLTPKQTDERDRLALERVLALDPEGLLQITEEENISMCGVIPATVMLFAAQKLGIQRAHLLKHYHSGDVLPMRKVVGYASVALES